MSASILLALLVVVGIALVVWWIYTLMDALRTPAATWVAAGQSQIIYVILLVFLNVIGSLVYVCVARPKLRAVSSAG